MMENNELILKPYQEDVFRKIEKGGNFLISWEMGLGKTYLAISLIKTIVQKCILENSYCNILIICPKSIIKTVWVYSLQKYGVEPVINAQIQDFSEDSGKISNPRIFLTNYEKIWRMPQFQKINFDLVITDECHKFKNHRSKITRGMMRLHARRKIAMSGIPLQNSPLEIYSIVNFLYTGFFNLKKFREDYCIMEKKFFNGRDVYVIKGYKNLEHLRKRIAPFTIFLSKEDVKEEFNLEKVEYITINVPMDLRTKELYNNILGLIKKQKWYSKNTISLITALRLLSSHPSLLQNSYPEYHDRALYPLKLSKLVNLIKSLEGKVVVFSIYTRSLDLISGTLMQEGVRHNQFRGDQEKKINEKSLDEFQKNPDIKVLICSDAGAYGLNITQASSIINFDLPYNPAVLKQRIGRLHRWGQNQKVVCYNLLMENSIEERVLQLLIKKSVFFEEVVAKDNEENSTLFKNLFNQLKGGLGVVESGKSITP